MPNRTCTTCDAPVVARGLCQKHYRQARKAADFVPRAVRNDTPAALMAALMAGIVVDPDSGCWTWQGTKTAGGYGQMRAVYRKVYTHRVSYELHVGPIPEGLVIDHLCRNRACANPEHLEPVTQQVNAGERSGKRLITHCPSGHEYAIHAYVNARGHRDCRACWPEENRRRWQRQRPQAA